MSRLGLFVGLVIFFFPFCAYPFVQGNINEKFANDFPRKIAYALVPGDENIAQGVLSIFKKYKFELTDADAVFKCKPHQCYYMDFFTENGKLSDDMVQQLKQFPQVDGVLFISVNVSTVNIRDLLSFNYVTGGMGALIYFMGGSLGCLFYSSCGQDYNVLTLYLSLYDTKTGEWVYNFTMNCGGSGRCEATNESAVYYLNGDIHKKLKRTKFRQ